MTFGADQIGLYQFPLSFPFFLTMDSALLLGQCELSRAVPGNLAEITSSLEMHRSQISREITDMFRAPSYDHTTT